MPTEKNHAEWMEYALKEAEAAMKRNEVPVGAIVVHNGIIVSKGFNQTEMLQDPTAHAEMIAITAAATRVGSQRLDDCTFYVTLEPCTMCAGAMVLARVPLLVFGAYDPKAGACRTLYQITEDKRLNHQVETVGGILEDRCGSILKAFFTKLRPKKN